VEWEDDAELILADMEFNDDSDEEREKKLRILVCALSLPLVEFRSFPSPHLTTLLLPWQSIYNAKLDERKRRKQFVLDHKLYDFKHMHAVEQRLSKEVVPPPIASWCHRALRPRACLAGAGAGEEHAAIREVPVCTGA